MAIGDSGENWLQEATDRPIRRRRVYLVAKNEMVDFVAKLSHKYFKEFDNNNFKQKRNRKHERNTNSKYTRPLTPGCSGTRILNLRSVYIPQFLVAVSHQQTSHSTDPRDPPQKKINGHHTTHRMTEQFIYMRLQLLLARPMGQYCFALWRLSPVVCNAPDGRAAGADRARGRSGGRHRTAGQNGYVPLGRHLVFILLVCREMP